LSSLTEHWAIIQGAIFIVLVMYAPDGLAGLILRAKNRLFSRVKIKEG
jgi:ABC-type branched-subunit amino acid transport system permease subunit